MQRCVFFNATLQCFFKANVRIKNSERSVFLNRQIYGTLAVFVSFFIRFFGVCPAADIYNPAFTNFSEVLGISRKKYGICGRGISRKNFFLSPRYEYKKLMWEFIMYLGAYVVVRHLKFFIFADRGGIISQSLLPAAFHAGYKFHKTFHRLRILLTLFTISNAPMLLHGFHEPVLYCSSPLLPHLPTSCL